jgi:hypothetical protein
MDETGVCGGESVRGCVVWVVYTFLRKKEHWGVYLGGGTRGPHNSVFYCVCIFTMWLFFFISPTQYPLWVVAQRVFLGWK